MTEFNQKTAFITGAASGIGLALTKALTAKGCNVMMADIDVAQLGRHVAEISGPGEVAVVVCDVRKMTAVEAAAKATFERFGNVHYVFNNAGVALAGQAGKIALEQWRWIVDINLMGVVHGVETFVPHIKAHGEGGHIINTASMAGHGTMPYMSPYHATKFAVVGYTEALRMELEPKGIYVTALCPTWVQSNIAGAARGGASEDEQLDAPTDALQKTVQDLVANGMPADRFAALVLKGIEAKRVHVFNDPEARPGLDMRKDALAKDYDACLEDLKSL